MITKEEYDETENEEVELYSSANEIETSQICSILKENDIPYIERKNGSGSYMDIYMGQSMQGNAIYVSKEDYDKAAELIADIQGSEEDIPTELEAKEDDGNDEEEKKYKMMGRVIGSIFLILPLVVAILIFLVIVMSSIY